MFMACVVVTSGARCLCDRTPGRSGVQAAGQIGQASALRYLFSSTNFLVDGARAAARAPCLQRERRSVLAYQLMVLAITALTCLFGLLVLAVTAVHSLVAKALPLSPQVGLALSL